MAEPRRIEKWSSGRRSFPAARDPVFGADSDALEQTDEMNVPLDAAARTDVRSTPPVGVASPATPIPLRTDDGRVVSVVHIVAELAPFARTGGLGEAVKSLAEFQSASGIPTAIIMPLYRQVHAVAPNLEHGRASRSRCSSDRARSRRG